MLRARYGHLDTGTFGAQFCDECIVNKIGVEPVGTGPSCYAHPQWQLLLTVYVDEFKVSGPKKYMDLAWKALNKHIEMEAPTGASLYIVCKRKFTDSQSAYDLVKKVLYGMNAYLMSSVALYQTVCMAAAGKGATLRTVATPFIEETRPGRLLKHQSPKDHALNATGADTLFPMMIVVNMIVMIISKRKSTLQRNM